MDALTIGAVTACGAVLAWPHVMKVYEWAKARKPVANVGFAESMRVRLEAGIVPSQSPGYHKWDVGELDALKYAVEKLPQHTSLAEFVDAIVPGEDCRDSVVTILAKGAKVK